MCHFKSAEIYVKVIDLELISDERSGDKQKLTNKINLIQPTISLEMPVPSQGHYCFPSFSVVD